MEHITLNRNLQTGLIQTHNQFSFHFASSFRNKFSRIVRKFRRFWRWVTWHWWDKKSLYALRYFFQSFRKRHLFKHVFSSLLISSISISENTVDAPSQTFQELIFRMISVIEPITANIIHRKSLIRQRVSRGQFSHKDGLALLPVSLSIEMSSDYTYWKTAGGKNHCQQDY